MARIALISDTDAIIRIERADRIDQTAGLRAGYRWLPVELVVVDTSTGPDTVTETSDPVVEAARVAVTRTSRDMTAGELAQRVTDRANTLLNEPLFRALGLVVFDLINDVRDRHGQGPITMAQFRNLIESKL